MNRRDITPSRRVEPIPHTWCTGCESDVGVVSFAPVCAGLAERWTHSGVGRPKWGFKASGGIYSAVESLIHLLMSPEVTPRMDHTIGMNFRIILQIVVAVLQSVIHCNAPVLLRICSIYLDGAIYLDGGGGHPHPWFLISSPLAQRLGVSQAMLICGSIPFVSAIDEQHP